MLQRDLLLLLMRKFIESLAKIKGLVEANKFDLATSLINENLDKPLVQQFLNKEIVALNPEIIEKLTYQAELQYLQIKIAMAKNQLSTEAKLFFIVFAKDILAIESKTFNLSLAQKLSEIQS